MKTFKFGSAFVLVLLTITCPILADDDSPPAFANTATATVAGNYAIPPLYCGDAHGATETYSFSFAGATVNTNFQGCCFQYNPGGYGVLPNLSLNVDSVYYAEITLLVPGEFCGVGMFLSNLPPCVEAVFTSSDKRKTDVSPRPTAVQYTVDIHRTTNAVPLAEWEIKDESGSSKTQVPQKGHYVLSADNMSQAIASVINVDQAEPFTFSIVGPDYGCTLTGTDNGAILTASTNTGTVHIALRFENSDYSKTNYCFVEDFYFDLVGCGCGCDKYENGSVDLSFDLGPSLVGIGNAFLQVKGITPAPNLGTPESLKCNFIRPELEKITNSLGWLRQVHSLDRIVDIITNSASSYSLYFYSPTNLLGMVNGLYQFTNSPFKTITIELVGGDTNHVRVTNSSDPAPADYFWETNGWALVTGNGLRRDTKSVTQNGAVRTEVRTIKNGQGTVEYQSTETWETFSYGDRLLSRVIGSGANALTNSNSYDSNGRLLQATRSDGSWDIYTYDSLGRQTGHYSPFLNSAPTTNSSECRFVSSTYDNSVVSGSGDDANLGRYTPRRVVEYVLGQEVSRRYTVVKAGERRDIQCTTPGAAWDATDNLVSTNCLRTDAIHYGKPWKIVRPDGRLQLTAYVKEPLPGTSTPNLEKTITWTGAPDGTGNSVTDGTREEIWIDLFQQVALTRKTDISSGYLTGQESYLYDDRGHLTNTVYLDGSSVQQIYDCCNLQTRIDRDGTVTSYGYDALKRLSTTSVNGITTSNVYNANGGVTSTVRYGNNGTAITQGTSTYDDAQRLTSTTDALAHLTTYTNFVDNNGQSIRTTAYPDLSTRIETYARDGSLLKVTGTAAHPVRYEYAVESDGGVQRFYKKEIKLDANGSDTAEWTKTYTDLLGRSYKTVYASASGTPASQSFYNSAGQLSQQVDPDGVTILYQYNAKGQLEFTAMDMHRDGQLHKDGTNRVTQMVSDVITNGAIGAVVQRTLTYVWPTNNQDLSRLVSSQEASVDGLQSWTTTVNNGVSVTNYSQVLYIPAQSYRIVKNVSANGSYSLATNQNGRLMSVTVYDSVGTQLARTTYGYDSYGRQNTVTDARNGTTTVFFDNADRLTGMLTPAAGPGQSAQAKTNYFDSMGRIWKTTLADNSSVTNEYIVTGELKKTYGSRTYPVEYAYDAQGRMIRMSTWTNFAASSVTTWNYDVYRGFLTNKAYADGNGTFYTYTAAGRLAARVWARGITTTYGYNNAGDMATVAYSDGTTANVTNTFDRLGRLIQIGTTSCAESLAYDDAGHLLTDSHSGGPLDGLTITSGYDSLLRRTSLSAQYSTTPLLQQSFGYDKASRLLSVMNGVHTVTYGYVANSPLVGSITFWQNGATRLMTQKQYDFLNRLVSISNTPSASGQSPIAFNYRYNDANQRIAITNSDNSRWIYQYDDLGQVISGKNYWADGTPVAGQQFEYGFDSIGNRISTKAGGDQSGAGLRPASYSVNNLNQYTSRTIPNAVDILGAASSNATVTVNGQTTYRKGEYYRDELALDNSATALWTGVTNVAVLVNGTNGNINVTNTGSAFLPQTPEPFGYDADGNLTNDGRWSYTWDGENRLISMTSLGNAPSGSKRKLDFAYDYRGRRTQKIVSTWNGSGYMPQSTNKFVYDGWNMMAVLNSEFSLLNSFTWGLDLTGTMQGAGGAGGLLGINNASSGVHFVAFDANGNVMALVSANDGTISARYQYGPFGELLRCEGTMAKLNPFRFSTKFRDVETDLLYYGYRYYDPSAGRWLNRDPIEEKGGINLSSFTQNRPVDGVDALGLYKLYDALNGKFRDEYFQTKEFIDALWQRMPYGYQAREIAKLLSTGLGLAKFHISLGSYDASNLKGGPMPDCHCVYIRMGGSTELESASKFVKDEAAAILAKAGVAKKDAPDASVSFAGDEILIEDCQHYHTLGEVRIKGTVTMNVFVGYSKDLKVASGSIGVTGTVRIHTPSKSEIGNDLEIKTRIDWDIKGGVEGSLLGDSRSVDFGPGSSLLIRVYPLPLKIADANSVK